MPGSTANGNAYIVKFMSLDVPLYVRIAAGLRKQILAGEVSPGDRLPTEADLIRRYSVARETARKALELLRREGVAVTRQGLGTFVREALPMERLALHPDDEAVSRMPTPDERLALGIGEGVPVIEVRSPGQKPSLYPSDRTVLTVA